MIFTEKDRGLEEEENGYDIIGGSREEVKGQRETKKKEKKSSPYWRFIQFGLSIFINNSQENELCVKAKVS